jgi:hypothetical protein
MTNNPYEGIIFAPAQNLFVVTIPNGRFAKFVTHCESLQEAIDARHAALNKPTQGHE